MPDFVSTLASNPALLQVVVTALRAAASGLTDAQTQLTTTSVTNLSPTWTGDVREAQRKHAQDLAARALGAVQMIIQAGAITSAASGQMQLQQAQLASLVTSATSSHYSVLPT